MSARIPVLAAVLLVLSLTACRTTESSATTSEAVEPTTTAGPTTSSIAPSTTATTSPTTRSDVCFSLTNYVAVAPNDNFTTVSDVATEVSAQYPTASAIEVLTNTSFPVGTEYDDTIASVIDGVLVFADVTGTDPKVAAQGLRDANLDAAVINTVGLANHIKFAPGTDAIALPTAPVINEPSDASPSNGPIAMVDSGIVNEGPGWLLGSVIKDDVDLEDVTQQLPASHGTFVASLIRRFAEAFPVSIAKAQQVDVAATTSSDPNEPVPDQALKPTSELQVFEALVRLAARHQEGNPPVVLNLSLGSYDCGEGALVMSQAVEYWQGTFEAPIVAAGGNDNIPDAFFPSATQLDDPDFITAVGAANRDGMEVVWHNNAEIDAAGLNRTWIEALAAGSNLVSIGNAEQWFNWSGSSFATAIATAMVASGVSISPSYTDVEGLTYQKQADPADPVYQIQSGVEVSLP